MTTIHRIAAALVGLVAVLTLTACGAHKVDFLRSQQIKYQANEAITALGGQRWVCDVPEASTNDDDYLESLTTYQKAQEAHEQAVIERTSQGLENTGAKPLTTDAEKKIAVGEVSYAWVMGC